MTTAASNPTPPPAGEAARIDDLAAQVAALVIAELERRGLAGELPALIDAAGLAKMLGESKRTVERWDQSGRIPRPLPLSRVKRWLRAEIDAWLLAGTPDRERWTAMRRSGAVRLGHAEGHGLRLAAQK